MLFVVQDRGQSTEFLVFFIGASLCLFLGIFLQCPNILDSGVFEHLFDGPVSQDTFLDDHRRQNLFAVFAQGNILMSFLR